MSYGFIVLLAISVLAYVLWRRGSGPRKRMRGANVPTAMLACP